MSLRLRKTAFAVLLVYPLASSALERTDLLPPAGTYFRITQAEQLRESFDRAYGNRLRADEKVQDFLEAFSEKFRKKSEDGKITLEVLQLIEMHKMLKGEIAMVYADRGRISQIENLWLTARATDEEFDRILERTAWLQNSSKDGVVRKRESFQGTELIVDIMRGGDTNEMSYWMGCVNDTLLLSSEREWMERNIVRLRNETIAEPVESKLSMRFPIGTWARASLRDKKDDRANLEALWSTLGLLDIEQYVLEIEMQDDTLIIDGTLSIGNMQRGLLRLLDTAPTDFSTDRVVPAAASSFSYGKADLDGFWQQVPEILSGLPLKPRAAFSGLIAFFEQHSGLNIATDLLAHTGNRFTLHTEQVNTNSAMLITLELHDGKALDQSLLRLLESPLARSWTDAVNITEFRGHTLYQLRSKNPAAEPMSLCIAGGRLLFGNRAPIVRDAVLRLESNFRPEPSALQRTARTLAPENAFGYGGMDHRNIGLLIQINVSDTTFSAGVGFQLSPGEGEKETLGENEISLNHLASFLNNSYHYAEAVPEGIHHRLIIEPKKNQGAP